VLPARAYLFVTGARQRREREGREASKSMI